MSMTSEVNDLIEQSIRVLSDPIDMSDWVPPLDLETSEQIAAAEQEEAELRLRARINAYLADRSDRLLALRHIREAALYRAEQYTIEAQRWATKARDQSGLANYVAELVRNVLVTERAQCGLEEGDAYKVEFPNGVKMGLRITRPVIVSDLDMLPAKLVRVKTTREPDKVAIGKLLKAGEAVSGACLGVSEHVDFGR